MGRQAEELHREPGYSLPVVFTVEVDQEAPFKALFRKRGAFAGLHELVPEIVVAKELFAVLLADVPPFEHVCYLEGDGTADGLFPVGHPAKLGEDGLYAKESSIYAPGLNLHRTVYCARNHEYYSEDPVLSAYMGNALCVGLKNKGTMAEPKHFAFNHQESNRSGLSTFMTEQAARENELRSFQMCMSLNNAQGIMTAFNRAGVAYSGAYRPTLVNIARNEWGYTGWFVTDMINGADYMNWRDIVAGGGGAALTSSAYDTSDIGAMENAKTEIEKDMYFQQQMREGIKYYLYNIAQSNAMNGNSSTTEIVYIRTWVDNALLGGTVVSGALTGLFLILAIVKDIKSKKED